jgi:hypothetical protein
MEELAPGVEIDRYGGDGGRFFAPVDTPYPDRALPYDPASLPYRVYIVRHALEVEACKTAAWFDEPGGGMQFESQESASRLMLQGAIAPEGGTDP